jgi:hypothetical protein
MGLLQALPYLLLPGAEEEDRNREGDSGFITVQKVYYPLLCILGIPGV